MSLQEYHLRMSRVLAYIDRHLEQPLPVNELAGIACFSAFHFHRLFHGWCGETIGDYIRRRRLEMAAKKLRFHADANVLDVALSVGFSSGEAFSRAFKSHFGFTPTAWRAGAYHQWSAGLHSPFQSFYQAMLSKMDQAANAETAHNDAIESLLRKASDMHVSLQTLAPQRLAVIRKTGPYGQAIHHFWMETFVPWLEQQGLMQQTKYGIGYDDPSITPAEKCRYDAGVEISADFPIAAPATELCLPGGLYAVYAFEGNVPDIFLAWRELIGVWLPQSGYMFDDRPCFERYDETTRYDPETGKFTCDICIAVRPLNHQP